MNYTKGEWKVYESPFAPAIIIEGKPSQPRRIIAVCRLERGSEDMAEATANANLIAASPLMYKMLKEIESEAVASQETPFCYILTGKMMSRVLELISKVESK